ncbi:MAG TPA: hypothetical protein VF473_05645, partial [Cyclobacteriaceae bacterium]
MIKKIFRWLLGIIMALVLLVAAMVGAIDRTPLHEQDFYNGMMSKLDSTTIDVHGASQLKSGWTKVNITPPFSMPMAGYIPRDHFESVHDSLYARIIIIQNESFRCAMVDVDLLIFPPLLRDYIRERMNDDTFLYLSATHTHNGVGGWDPSMGGRLITGSFKDAYVKDIAGKIAQAIKSVQTQNSTLQYFEADASDLVEN